MTHEQGPTGGDQPRAPGESVNETAADGREEASAVEEAKNGGPVSGKPEPPVKPSRPSSGGGGTRNSKPWPPAGRPASTDAGGTTGRSAPTTGR